MQRENILRSEKVTYLAQSQHSVPPAEVCVTITVLLKTNVRCDQVPLRTPSPSSAIALARQPSSQRGRKRDERLWNCVSIIGTEGRNKLVKCNHCDAEFSSSNIGYHFSKQCRGGQRFYHRPIRSKRSAAEMENSASVESEEMYSASDVNTSEDADRLDGIVE